MCAPERRGPRPGLAREQRRGVLGAEEQAERKGRAPRSGVRGPGAEGTGLAASGRADAGPGPPFAGPDLLPASCRRDAGGRCTSGFTPFSPRSAPPSQRLVRARHGLRGGRRTASESAGPGSAAGDRGDGEAGRGPGGGVARPVRAARTRGAASPGGVRTCPARIPRAELLCSRQGVGGPFCCGVGDARSGIKIKDWRRTKENVLGVRSLLKKEATKEAAMPLQEH